MLYNAPPFSFATNHRMSKQHAIIYPYFVLVVVVMTYPLVTVFGTHFIGDPFSDAYEYSRHIWWMNYAIRHGEPVFFQPLLAYPDGLSGAWLWGNPFQSFPAWLFAFVMPLPAAYNLGALLHLSLNGWAAYLLCWHLTRNLPAALLGGTVFALYPAIQGHLIGSHTGLVTLWGAPLYVLMLLRLEHRTGWRGIALTALFFVLSILGNSLLLIYMLFPLTVVFLLVRLLNRQWGWLRRAMIAVVLGGAGALVFVAPVAIEQLNATLPTQGGDVLYSADVLAAFAPSFYNPLFSDLAYSRRVLGEVKNVEGTGYVGAIAAVLALVALLRIREARWWGGVALFAWVMSLGPLLKINDTVVSITLDGYSTHILLPWALLGELPVLSIARTPGRFNLALGLAVAVLAAYGFTEVSKRAGRQFLPWAALVILVPIIAFEYQVMWQNGLPHMHTIPDRNIPELAALRDDDSVRAVFNIPYDHLLVEKDGMHLQTHHHKPLVGGHVTRRTPVSPAQLSLLQNTLDPTMLDAAKVDMIILHRAWAPPDLEPFTREKLGIPLYQDERVVVWRAPRMELARE